VAPVVLSGTDDVEDTPIGSQKAAEIPERGELGSKMPIRIQFMLARSLDHIARKPET